MTTAMRTLFLSVLALLAACSRSAPKLDVTLQRTAPWSEETVNSLATLPLQFNGRVMPFSTLAAFTLYHVHGRRDLKYEYAGDDGQTVKVTLEPTEWLLDVWCYPDQAAHYPLFRIEHVGVLDALGIANDGQGFNFDYLSFAELLRHAEKLRELAGKYFDIEQKNRSPVQEHLVQLWGQLRSYHKLHTQLEAFQGEFEVQGEAMQQLLGGSRVGLATIVERGREFRAWFLGLGDEIDDPKHGNVLRILEMLNRVVDEDHGPLLLPPTQPVGSADTWHTIGETVKSGLMGNAPAPHVAMVGHLQKAMSAPSVADKAAALREYRDAVVAAAKTRGEYGKVELETYYYRSAWHYQAIHWFLFAFVLAAACWMVPSNRWLWGASMAVTMVALGMLTADVWLRCVIRERPPITNLYDTFLFIGGVSVLVAWIAEWILPRRLALAAAPLLGAVLIMCARAFEVSDGQDTMKPLVAVLDSNFWLATHVTTINIGYAAGVLAAILANFWIFARVLRVAAPSEPIAKSLVRMIYGVTAFSLVFGVVGTILGGVWANDSWGRFWGWDPKENGALMICLSQIAMLHARMTGWVRDLGMVVWSSITGMVVLFSWFHVNLLQVGLHSYGFSAGLHNVVWTSYTVELALVGIVLIDALLRPNPAPRQARVGGDAAVPVAAE